jgi:hypothetical protein
VNYDSHLQSLALVARQGGPNAAAAATAMAAEKARPSMAGPASDAPHASGTAVASAGAGAGGSWQEGRGVPFVRPSAIAEMRGELPRELPHMRRSTRAYAREGGLVTHGVVPKVRSTVGRRNVDCFNTVIDPVPAPAPDSLRRKGHLVYRSVGQRIVSKVGDEALLAPPPPAGHAPDQLRKPNYAHSDITQYSEHLRRLPCTITGDATLL